MKKLFTFFYLLSLLIWGTNAKAQVTNGLIQHFKFDNSFTNEAGDISFSAAYFTANRDGVPNSAISIAYALQSQATIPGLPYGNAPRTISFWARAAQYSGLNYDPVFTYGTGTEGNAFSGSFSLDRASINAHTSHATWILGGGTQNVVGTWYHYTMTYDGTTAKIYRNGVLMGSETRTWNTINNNDIFKLGVGVGGEQWFSGAIDDLKIFDRAVDASEATLLYKGDIDVCSNLLSYFSFDGNVLDHTESIGFTTTDGPMYPITSELGRRGGADYALKTFQNATQPRTITLPGLPTGNNPRTIVFWMKTSTPFSTTQVYFSYGTAANAQTFGLYNNASGNLVFYGFGAGNDVTTSATIGQNVWTQVAVVHNSHMVRIYTNGTLRHSFTPANTLNTGNSTFKIGAFNGGVDDLAIYNRALSFGEIEHLFNNSALNCPFPPGTNSFPVEYTFDNTLSNTDGLNTFTGPGTSFVADRSSTAQKALAIATGTGATANISIIPKGNDTRSVAIWYKVNSNTGNPGIFNYGSSGSLERFGLYLGNSGNPIFQASGTDHAFGGTYAANTWHQAVITYNGSSVKMYVNGSFLGSQPYTLATGGNSNFRLGNGAALAVDDLQIYDRELTAIEIYNSFHSTVSASLPVINLSSVNVSITNATINYQINPNGGIATSVINYGLSNVDLSSQASGFSATGASLGNNSAIITGLQPNTTYYYQVVVTNSVGTTNTIVDSFTTADFSKIAEYKFDNTHTDINGNYAFGNSGTSFVADRNADANAAISIASTTTMASIPNLPTGNNSRTVSIWYKMNSNASGPGVFVYGTDASMQKFGMYLGANGNPVFQAYGSDKDFGGTYAANTWHHAVITYDGTTVKMYMNGVFIGQQTYTLATGNSVFILGNTRTTLAVDDLKIYDYALSATDVLSLYSHNIVLPVNLVSFTAKAQNNSAVLNWQTAQEINNKQFIVYRKGAEGEFTAIGTKQGAGTVATPQSYVFYDNSPLNGINYYKLVQVDNDGKTTDLGIKTVTLNLTPYTVSLFPNPTTNQANVGFVRGAFHSAKLVNVNGQVLQSVTIGKTQQTVTFNLDNYTKGVYFIKLQGNNQNAIQKVIKQ